MFIPNQALNRAWPIRPCFDLGDAARPSAG